MKAPLSFLALLTCLATGCSKHSSTSANFQFQLSNALYTFDSVVASIDTSAGVPVTAITALNTKTRSTCHILLQSNGGRLTGVYSHLDPAPVDEVLIDFGVVIESGQNIYAYSVEGAHFTLTVSSSAGSTLTGSFSGSIAELIDSQNATMKAGQFSIPYSYE